MSSLTPSRLDLVLVGALLVTAITFVVQRHSLGSKRETNPKPPAERIAAPSAIRRPPPDLADSARSLKPQQSAAAHESSPFSSEKDRAGAVAVPMIRDYGFRQFAEAIDIADLEKKELGRYARIGAAYMIRLHGFERFTKELDSAQLRTAVRNQLAMPAGWTDISCRDLAVRTNVGRRADWLESITDDPEVLGAMFGTWVGRDFNAAAEWLSKRQPAPKYDQVGVWVVDAMNESGNPEAAKGWLSWITDPEKRERMAGFVEKRLEKRATTITIE